MTKINEHKTRVRLIDNVLNKKKWKNLVKTEVSFKTHYQGVYKSGRMDYALYDPSNPSKMLAVIEAKDINAYSDTGLDQARVYAKAEHINYAISTNGVIFDIYNTKTGCTSKKSMKDFPTPNQLKYPSYNMDKLKEILQLPYLRIGNKTPRYYQKEAINNVFYGMFEHRKHMLLAMATGSGKTYVASQIVHRAFEATDKHLLNKPINHVLYLADRTNLLKQPLAKDFHTYQKKHMAHYYDKSELLAYGFDDGKSILMESYQMFYGNYLCRPYKFFKKNSVDLIIVDEAHRGSARITSNWHKILSHFPNATVIGMTATPKETSDANEGYYGYPIYSYPLTKGIHDGYLAPYHLVECKFKTKTKYMKYDNTLLNSMVTKKIIDIESEHGGNAKLIVFCQSIRHAHQLEQGLLNCGFKDVDCFTSRERRKFKHGLLLNFENPSSTPMVAITSQLMSTGIDVPSLSYIILDKHFKSNIELEQVIGRGTRKYKNKEAFTVIDYGNNGKMLTDIPVLKQSNIDYNKDIQKSNRNKNNSEIKSIAHKSINKPRANQKVTIISKNVTKSSQIHNGTYVKDNDIFTWRQQMHLRWSTPMMLTKQLTQYVINSSEDFYNKLFKNGYITFPDFRKMQKSNHNSNIDAFILLLNKYYDIPLETKKTILSLINSYKTNDETMNNLINYINETYSDNNSLLDYASLGLVFDAPVQDSLDWLNQNEHNMNQYITNVCTLLSFVLISLQRIRYSAILPSHNSIPRLTGNDTPF